MYCFLPRSVSCIYIPQCFCIIVEIHEAENPNWSYLQYTVCACHGAEKDFYQILCFSCLRFHLSHQLLHSHWYLFVFLNALFFNCSFYCSAASADLSMISVYRCKTRCAIFKLSRARIQSKFNPQTHEKAKVIESR